jgi:hypothetical protein
MSLVLGLGLPSRLECRALNSTCMRNAKVRGARIVTESWNVGRDRGGYDRNPDDPPTSLRQSFDTHRFAVTLTDGVHLRRILYLTE